MLQVELPVGYKVLLSAPDLGEKSERSSTNSAPKESIMPFARIDLLKGKPAEYRATLADVVYQGISMS